MWIKRTPNGFNISHVSRNTTHTNSRSWFFNSFEKLNGVYNQVILLCKVMIIPIFGNFSLFWNTFSQPMLEFEAIFTSS